MPVQKPKDITIPTDPWGLALWDYWNGQTDAQLYTQTTHSEVEILPVSYLFRTLELMPSLEQQVMREVHGRVLDIGCGAGAHLQVLAQQGVDALGVDSNPMAVYICQQRGLKAQCTSDWTQIEGTFDHILLLMNGTGLLTPLEQLEEKLGQLKKMLTPSGVIWIDTTDIAYLWPGNIPKRRLAFGPHYYGYVNFTVQYRGLFETLPWLYLDETTARYAFENAGFKAVKKAQVGASLLWCLFH